MKSEFVREYLPALPVHNVSEEARERAAFIAAEREYRLRAEIARLRLTDAERQAIEWVCFSRDGAEHRTLRKLLERLA